MFIPSGLKHARSAKWVGLVGGWLADWLAGGREGVKGGGAEHGSEGVWVWVGWSSPLKVFGWWRVDRVILWATFSHR